MSSLGFVCAHRIEVAEEIRALDTLTTPDYASAYEVIAAADTRSPEQWARAVFEDAPRALRAFIVAGWIAGLGIQLGPRPSRDHVLGWKIAAARAGVIILSAHSVVLGTAHLVLRVKESQIVLASFVRYERRLAPAVWRIVSPMHHQILLYLLGRAASQTQCP